LTIQNPELLLVIGMVGLYLYDSTMLLASNEVILSHERKGKWSALFGADGFQVRRKEPFLPNPFFPHRPLYRFAWNTTGFVGPSQPWAAPSNPYGVLAPFIWCMAVALFILIPLGLFSRLSNVAIFAGVTIFYASGLMALVIVWLKRDIYGISSKQFVSLAFESLTCPPFAINMVRHLSLDIKPAEDFLSAADRLLEEDARKSALKKVIFRVQSEIDWEDVGTAHAEALNTQLKYLNREINTCRVLNS
jgi:hypothetical protein